MCKRPSNFQQLTNCLKFATLSEPLSSQSLPTVKFCNSFLLITIQIARGGYSPLPARHLKFCFNSLSGRGVRNSLELSETVNSKLWTADCFALAFPISDVQPAGAVALAARHLAVLPCGLAGRTNLPVGLVRRTANHAGATLADGDLGALTVNHLRRVGDGPTAGAHGHGLRFLFRHGRGRSAPSSRIWAGPTPVSHENGRR